MIRNPPKQLYVMGNEKILNKLSVAIVGSRKNTLYGKKVAEYFSKELTLRDVVIVSGAAVGIDTISHKTCMEFDGKTIAVLGFGFDNISKRKDKEIFNEILDKGGLLVSEYPPEKDFDNEDFKMRNRIISGLSEAVIVIESSERSGTTITGNHALTQKKKLFSVPNSIFEKKSIGANNFLKKGAYMLTSIEDILEKIPEIPKEKREIQNKKSEYEDIYEIIKSGINEKEMIIEYLKKDIVTVNKILFELEIQELIEYKVGKGYIALDKKG